MNTSVNQYNNDLTNYTVTISSTKSPQGKNIQYTYRKDTNFCMRCDYRCMKCFGPINTNCTACINHYYLWTNATVCSSLCPTGQYQLNISAPYPDNETKCGNCDVHCIACIGYNNNCTSCQPFSSANYAFLFTYQPLNATCMTTCPVSTSTLTTKGYYGSISTMVCYPCPNQCSNCNINLVMDTALYPELQPIVCGNDYLCSAGIQCTSCLQGYSLVAGQCVNQYTCQLYSYYQKGNSSAAWSPSNCVCLPGYYFSSTINCSPCDFSCSTCSGPSATDCTSCPEGYSLQSSTCLSTNTGSQVYVRDIWYSPSPMDANLSTSNPFDFHNCGSYYTLFGYKSSLTTTSTFTYSTGTISTANYYGIGFKVQALFIDNWDGSSGLFFTLDSDPNPTVIYNYNNYGAIGDQQCGTNLPDYVMNI